MEFAVVAPILFALVFGIFDFGRAMSANVTVTNSAREGARYAATHTTTWQAPSGSWPATNQANYGFECPQGTPLTAPSASGASGQAWRQLQAANLDLTKVSIKVSYYKSSNDPSTATSADETEYCDSTGKAYDVAPGGASLTGANASGTYGYGPQTGDWVRVEVIYTYSAVTPVISQLLGGVIKVDQTSTMVLE